MPYALYVRVQHAVVCYSANVFKECTRLLAAFFVFIKRRPGAVLEQPELHSLWRGGYREYCGRFARLSCLCISRTTSKTRLTLSSVSSFHPPQFLWRIHHIFYQLMYSNSMPPKSKMPQLLTLKQTSELLNVHPNTLRQWDEKRCAESRAYWRAARPALSSRRRNENNGEKQMSEPASERFKLIPAVYLLLRQDSRVLLLNDKHWLSGWQV